MYEWAYVATVRLRVCHMVRSHDKQTTDQNNRGWVLKEILEWRRVFTTKLWQEIIIEIVVSLYLKVQLLVYNETDKKLGSSVYLET